MCVWCSRAGVSPQTCAHLLWPKSPESWSSSWKHLYMVGKSQTLGSEDWLLFLMAPNALCHQHSPLFLDCSLSVWEIIPQQPCRGSQWASVQGVGMWQGAHPLRACFCRYTGQAWPLPQGIVMGYLVWGERPWCQLVFRYHVPPALTIALLLSPPYPPPSDPIQQTCTESQPVKDQVLYWLQVPWLF